MNEDGNGSSQYYYKPADSQSTKAYAGPCWDYDSTFACFAPSKAREGIIKADAFHTNKGASSDYWWPQLYLKTEFKDAVMAAWKSKYRTAMQILMGEALDVTGQLQSVDTYAAAIAKSAEMNFLRWPISSSKFARNVKRTGLTWEANLTYLKSILRTRFDFLDKQWNK